MGRKPVKLWIIQYLFFPVWAGPALRFFNYSKKFQAQDIDIQFVTAWRPETLTSESYEGIPITRLGKTEKNKEEGLNKFLWRALLGAVFTKDRPDVLLFLLATPLHAPLIRLLKLFKIKTIFVSTMASPRDSKRSGLRKFISNRLQKFYFNSFDSIVCSTDRLAEDILDLKIAPKRITTIPNGVSLTRFKTVANLQEKISLRRELKLPENELIFLNVGLIDPRKGVLDLLAGWKEYIRTGGEGSLVFVGQQQRELTRLHDFFDKWDREFSLSKNCIWQNASPKIESYFKASDIFVFLSRLEGLPNVLPEAMASSLPILTTEFIGFSQDFGVPGQHLLLTDRDPEIIAENLHNLSKQTQLRSNLGIQARKFVEENHDVEKSIHRYINLFRGLAQNPTISKSENICAEL